MWIFQFFLLFSMITDAVNRQSFAHKIPIGKRLFTLEVNLNEGPSGSINPGDHVDIIANMNFEKKGTTLFTLLENIIVTAVGDVTDPGKKIEANAISFFVDPKELERLHFAQTYGTFFISLRNPYDKSKIKKSEGIDKDKFLLSSKVYDAANPDVKVNIE